MNIEELIAGQNITIQVIVNGEQLELPTTVLEVLPKKHSILAAPIMKGDKVLSFRGEGILTHLIVAYANEKPQIFYNIVIRTMKLPDNTFSYLITTPAPSRTFNRRNAYRCFVGIPSTILVGLNRTAEETIIKDVSLTGFSFVVPSGQTSYTVGSTVHTVLSDFVDERKENYSFHLYGVIVRVSETENNKVMYGCRLVSKVAGLDRYIVVKERLQLSKNTYLHS